ncbi:hypothetical protein GCM10022261_19550 [Brevibacterium daeguense]|uniref:Uncharacterized protein n=1 Tax=Brevibacterium daeguense TaxID=909936 RepID=A0ABP8EKC0_9MICO
MSTNDRDKDFDPTTAENGTGNPNLDPNASGDADLDAGGGVRPGSTPPESNQATASPAHPPARKPPKSKGGIIALIVLVVIVAFVFVAYAVGLFA